MLLRYAAVTALSLERCQNYEIGLSYDVTSIDNIKYCVNHIGACGFSCIRPTSVYVIFLIVSFKFVGI